jgi:uncharacterized protein (UPF0548 family)
MRDDGAMLRLRRPSQATLERLLERARASKPTYDEVDATRTGPTGTVALPDGYRHDRFEVALGRGEDVFGRASAALREWLAHTGAGVEVFPARGVEAGATILLVVRTIGLWAVAPCRIVYMIDEPDRYGFAYGTLPGHPERGEAAFTIVRRGEQASFEILSFSRSVDPLARLAKPVALAVQRRVTLRYLDALAASVRR